MTKDEIETALAESQATFLALLQKFMPAKLHQQQSAEPWTPAVIMLHMCEAREHYAADVNKLVDSDASAVVGRSTDDPGRLAVIARAAAGGITGAEIEVRLVSSFATMMSAVARVDVMMLDRPVQIARPEIPTLTVAEFLARFLVGHHKLHVNQLAALL